MRTSPSLKLLFFKVKSRFIGLFFLFCTTVSFAQIMNNETIVAKDTSTIVLDTGKGKKAKIAMKSVDDFINNLAIKGLKESRLNVSRTKVVQW